MRSEAELVPFSVAAEVNPRDVPNGNRIPYVAMQDVSEEGRLLRVEERPLADVATSQPTFRDDDILFAKITPCMENGKGALVHGLGHSVGYGSTEFHVLRPTGKALPGFIHYWTCLRRFRRAAEATMTGSGGQRRVPAEFFRAFRIPLPSLPEQHRIVEILDSVTETERVLARTKAKLSIITSSARSSLIEELSNSEAVRVKDLGNVRGGKQLSPSGKENPEQYPYLRVANVLAGRISFSDVKTMHFTNSEKDTYQLQPGDILLNEGQSLELVGRSAIYNEQPGKFFFQNTLIRFRPGPRVKSRFAQEVFTHWLASGRFSGIAKQTTSIAHLGSERFASMSFPEATIARQEQVIAILDAQLQRSASVERQLAKLRLLREGLADDLLSGRVPVGSVS